MSGLYDCRGHRPKKLALGLNKQNVVKETHCSERKEVPHRVAVTAMAKKIEAFQISALQVMSTQSNLLHVKFIHS